MDRGLDPPAPLTLLPQEFEAQITKGTRHERQGSHLNLSPLPHVHMIPSMCYD